MEICDFAFHRPATLAEACELGRKHGKDARFLAGGTELLPDLKQHRDTLQHLIDLRQIDGLKEIREDDGGLRIGCLASLTEVAESASVRKICPSLSEAILTMAAVQIRNRGTLGGNFCGAVPSADTPPICIAAKAEVLLAGVDGQRSLPAEDFFVAPRETALRPGELLAEVRIPLAPRASGADYQRFALRQATALAVVGVAARIDLEGKVIREARVALGAVAPVPLLATACGEMMEGKTPSEELFCQAAETAATEARPISDLRGSVEFRRELVQVLTVRALRQASTRAHAAAGSTKP
jgi:carbon-monoxide dehydrogenase medium subunit